MDEAQLVIRAQLGEREAFAEVYDRYGVLVFAYCRFGRSDEAAALATAITFALFARGRLRWLDDPSRLKPWLLGLAQSVLRRWWDGQQAVVVGEVEVADLPSADKAMGPAKRGVLEAAAWGLERDDQELLAAYLLEIRGKLTRAELARVRGLTRDGADVRVARLRERLRQAIVAVVVARQAQEVCPKLDRIVSERYGLISPTLCKQVVRHARRCERCGLSPGAARSADRTRGVGAPRGAATDGDGNAAGGATRAGLDPDAAGRHPDTTTPNAAEDDRSPAACPGQRRSSLRRHGEPHALAARRGRAGTACSVGECWPRAAGQSYAARISPSPSPPTRRWRRQVRCLRAAGSLRAHPLAPVVRSDWALGGAARRSAIAPSLPFLTAMARVMPTPTVTATLTPTATATASLAATNSLATDSPRRVTPSPLPRSSRLSRRAASVRRRLSAATGR